MRTLLYALLLPLSFVALAQSTLDSVRSKGFVQCGVNTGLAGFSAPDDKGRWTGLDADYCRAIAAAVLIAQRLIGIKSFQDQASR